MNYKRKRGKRIWDIRLNNMQINQRDIEYLIAIQKYRSVSKSADACGITQPALSNQLKRIEDKMGVKIFDRKTTSIKLTTAGNRILSSAEGVLKEMREMSDIVRMFQDPFSFPVNLGIFPTLAPYAVPLLCRALNGEFPALEIIYKEAYSDQLIEQMTGRGLDLALLALPFSRDNLEVTPLFEEVFYLVVPKTHALANQESVKEEELPLSEIILLEKGHCLTDQALSLCGNDKIGSDIPSGLSATSILTICQYISHGFGCTFLPALAVEAMKPSLPSCRFLKIESSRYKRQIGLVNRASCPRKPLVAPLVESIKKNLDTDSISIL